MNVKTRSCNCVLDREGLMLTSSPRNVFEVKISKMCLSKSLEDIVKMSISIFWISSLKFSVEEVMNGDEHGLEKSRTHYSHLTTKLTWTIRRIFVMSCKGS